MALDAPATGMAIATAAARPSSALESGGSGGVNGSPGATDPVEKDFQRKGFEIVEVAASEIAGMSNDRKNVAFCIVDDDEVGGTWKMSDPNAVFARAADDMEISLGDHFRGGGALVQTEDRADGVELRGFGVDARENGKGAKFTFNRGGLVRGVEVHGEQDGVGDWPAGVYATLTNHGEALTLRGYKARGGASRTPGISSTHDSIGVLLDGRSNGLLRMENCEIGSYPNNGLYASGSRKHGNKGRAIVEDCVFRGSDRDGVRVGNNSVVRRTDIINDNQGEGKDNFRGFWLRYARGVVIEDCTVKTFPGNDPGSAFRIDENAGRVTIRGCDVELRGSNKAARGIEAYSPNGDVGDSLLTVKDTRFHGEASPKQVVLVKEGRDTDFDGLQIDKPLRDNADTAIDVR